VGLRFGDCMTASAGAESFAQSQLPMLGRVNVDGMTMSVDE